MKKFIEWYEKKEYHYEVFEEENLLHGAFAIKNNVIVNIWITFDEKDFIIDFDLSKTPMVEDADELIKLIAMINFRIQGGAYQYDFDNKTVSYRKYIRLLNGSQITDEEIESIINGGVNGIIYNLDCIIAVMTGALSAEEAIDAAIDEEIDEVVEEVRDEQEDNAEEDKFENEEHEIRYRIEHDILSAEYLKDPLEFLSGLDADRIFEKYDSFFSECEVQNPYSRDDFSIKDYSSYPYHIKRIVLPKRDYRFICNEIFLVYAENTDLINEYPVRYFTLELAKHEGERLLFLCEWACDEEGWSHYNHGPQGKNAEERIKAIEHLIGADIMLADVVGPRGRISGTELPEEMRKDYMRLSKKEKNWDSLSSTEKHEIKDFARKVLMMLDNRL